jgi:hypothetical protein
MTEVYIHRVSAASLDLAVHRLLERRRRAMHSEHLIQLGIVLGSWNA